jgi:hypothetical protein
MGDAVLADRQTQLLYAGVRLDEAFKTAIDLESSTQRLARRAAVAEPGGQTPGITVNSEALRHPHLELPSNNQGASASGSSQQKILPEVSAGTNLMTARKAHCICFGT